MTKPTHSPLKLGAALLMGIRQSLDSQEVCEKFLSEFIADYNTHHAHSLPDKPPHSPFPEWCNPDPAYPPLRVEERQAMGVAHWALVDKYDQVVCRFDFLDDDDGKSRAHLILQSVNRSALFEEMVGLLKGTVDYYEIQGLTGPASLVKDCIRRAQEASK